jgi:hypothetical protein
MTLNPIRLIRRRRRLRRAIEDEVFHLRRVHGEGAHAAALQQLGRPDLTSWGRKIVQGAAKETAVSPRHPNGRQAAHHAQHVHQVRLPQTIAHPIKAIRRRRRLRRAAEEEAFHLRRVHGAGAHAAALQKLKRPDLTSWGRQVVQGAAKEILVMASQARAQQVRRLVHFKVTIRDPISVMNRRSRLRRAIEEEVMYLRRVHGQAARIAAAEKLARADRTHWGRQIVLGAAKEFNS